MLSKKIEKKGFDEKGEKEEMSWESAIIISARQLNTFIFWKSSEKIYEDQQ